MNQEKIDSPFSIVIHSRKTKSFKFISTCFSFFLASTIPKKGEKYKLGIDSREENFPVVEGEYEPVDTLLVQEGKVLMPLVIAIRVTGKTKKPKVLSFSY